VEPIGVLTYTDEGGRRRSCVVVVIDQEAFLLCKVMPEFALSQARLGHPLRDAELSVEDDTGGVQVRRWVSLMLTSNTPALGGSRIVALRPL
jgi:hypothetical protein